MRGLAVLHRLGTGVIVLPAPLAPWAEALGFDHVAVTDPRDPAWLDRVTGVDLLLVDVFPRGVVGELVVPPGTPAWLVSRRVAAAYYLDPGVRAAIESRYELIVWTEEPPAELAALRVPAVRIAPVVLDAAPLDRAEARARLGVPDRRPLVLALGAGNPGRQADLRGLLARIAARAAAALRFVSHELPEDGEVVRLFPASAWLAAADVVVAAGGYHAVHETRRAGVPAVFVPQRRRYDDQAWRVRGETVAASPAELERAIQLKVGGPDMAPHAPPRSERPGKPVTLLDLAGSAQLATLVERRVERGVLAQEEIAAMA